MRTAPTNNLRRAALGLALASGLCLTPAIAQNTGQQAPPPVIVEGPEEVSPEDSRVRRAVDVRELIRIVDDATVAVAEPLVRSRLSERFEEVSQELRRGRIDKRRLRSAMSRLESELGRFIDDLDSMPLFDAQDAIGQSIDRVRMLIATGPSGTTNEEMMQQVQRHEDQLRQLVAAIDREADEGRKERLKIMFAHHLRLKRLKESMATVDMNNTQMRVFAKTVQALDMLSTQLVSAGFKVEEARAILAQQRDFINSYLAVVDGLIEAEELSALLRGLGGTGDKLRPMIGDLAGLAQQAADFSVLMNEVGDQLIFEIDDTADQLTADLDETRAGLNLNIEAEMARYRNPPQSGNRSGNGSGNNENNNRSGGN